MPRTVEVKINGTAYHMPVTFKASKEIAERVGDPLKLAVAANQNRGAVAMSIVDVVNIITIGCKHAGCSLPADEIGELIVEAGVTNYLPIVGEYLLSMCTGSSEVKAPAKKGARKSPG